MAGRHAISLGTGRQAGLRSIRYVSENEAVFQTLLPTSSGKSPSRRGGRRNTWTMEKVVIIHLLHGATDYGAILFSEIIE
ncbi:hypothetical protein REJC140_03603 [Pseudorhizobium endolithicum]|jgi:hypothetical protein|uniref:Transposase n=1 Tax=Pseudorhizobium endolithicum TaxID=1191678 RepID=A0ABM8PLV4_9HYPH|nr:hypothetical protein REJC140_03603 [Pseudorhizobium endolithicum]